MLKHAAYSHGSVTETVTNTGLLAICPFLRASVGGDGGGNKSPDTSGGRPLS